jgi:hypothetical protein
MSLVGGRHGGRRQLRGLVLGQVEAARGVGQQRGVLGVAQAERRGQVADGVLPPLADVRLGDAGDPLQELQLSASACWNGMSSRVS